MIDVKISNPGNGDALFEPFSPRAHDWFRKNIAGDWREGSLYVLRPKVKEMFEMLQEANLSWMKIT